MPFLCLAPDRPLCALPIVSMRAEIRGQAIIEGVESNPIAVLVTDPRKRLVLSVEIVNVPVGP